MLPRYINGEEATPAMLVQYPVTEDFRGRLTSVLGLRYLWNIFKSHSEIKHFNNEIRGQSLKTVSWYKLCVHRASL